MVSGLSQLVPLALYSMGLTTSSGIGLMKYRPYGPMMCLQVCGDSGGSFILLKGYHCRRISQKDPQTFKTLSSEDSFRCFNIHKVADYGTCLRNLPREDMLNVSAKVTMKPKVHPDFTTDFNCDQHLKWTPKMTLHQACKEGKLPTVRCLLLKGLDIDSRRKSGQTPVMVAVMNRHFAVFDFLVRKGCDLSLIDDFNNTILHAACTGGNLAIITKLVDTLKYDIESKSTFGITPVLYAAYYGQREVFSFLKRKGCNLTVVDYDNNNILHFSSMSGNPALVQDVVSLNVVGIDSRGYVGRTPVMNAAMKNSRDVVDLLVRAGCSLTVVDNHGNNILHQACCFGPVNMVNYILSLNITGVGPESRQQSGRTPVMLAATRGQIEIVDLLISKGCNLTTVDKGNNNILHLACLGGYVDMVKFVLKLMVVNVNWKNKYGQTPEQVARFNGHTAAVNPCRGRRQPGRHVLQTVLNSILKIPKSIF